ncbi:esterase OVCA2 isoform X4 [Neoarius graeffei]|uniref:esterase OVCA2 isoform X4 n=1 Tax=Neoarius graeffei TaxID=443677 RepID=UPI00298C1676|nr:esterase OVCA2 isoform X4 [Neoarius graeffei]
MPNISQQNIAQSITLRPVCHLLVAHPGAISSPDSQVQENPASVGGDQRGWWFSDAQAHSFDARQESESSFGLEQSLEVVQMAVKDLGPFDGILGFSQGAALVAMLCSLQEKKLDPTYNFRFAILVAGFRSACDQHQYFYKGVKIMVPSLHVYGQDDKVIPEQMSQDLLRLFQGAHILAHQGARRHQGSREIRTVQTGLDPNNLVARTGITSNQGSVVLTYTDDLLVSAESPEICRDASLRLLQHLVQKGFKVSRTKLQFCKDTVKYLGFELSQGCRKLSADRVQAILDTKRPATKHALMSFLGLINYCRQWIPDCSSYDKILRSAISHQDPQRHPLTWTDTMINAYHSLKSALCSAPALGLPDYSKPFHLYACEQQGTVSGVLAQEHGGGFIRVRSYLKD